MCSVMASYYGSCTLKTILIILLNFIGACSYFHLHSLFVLIVIIIIDIPGFVIAGNRNPIPSDCPVELQTLMASCWHSNPSERYYYCY